jgi:hypothetical protein
MSSDVAADRRSAGKFVAATALAVLRVLVGINLLGASQQLGSARSVAA